MDERIVAALIGATVAASFAFIREFQVARWQRRGKVRDLQIALCAEIRAYLAVLELDNLDRYAVAMVERMRREETLDRPYIPLIPIEKNDTIFNVVAPEIHVLPRSSVNPVAVYYSQIVAISALIEDMRTPEFRQLELERRIGIYEDYIEMKREAIVLGKEALLMMETHINRGLEGIEEIEEARRNNFEVRTKADLLSWLNSRASVRSDR